MPLSNNRHCFFPFVCLFVYLLFEPFCRLSISWRTACLNKKKKRCKRRGAEERQAKKKEKTSIARRLPWRRTTGSKLAVVTRWKANEQLKAAAAVLHGARGGGERGRSHHLMSPARNIHPQLLLVGEPEAAMLPALGETNRQTDKPRGILG